jgi:sulfite exporter TauE/SafE
MLAFGLGTLPNLLLMGVFADTLRQFIQQKPVRLLAGLLVAGMGLSRLLLLAHPATARRAPGGRAQPFHLSIPPPFHWRGGDCQQAAQFSGRTA